MMEYIYVKYFLSFLMFIHVWFQAGALGHVSLEFKAVRYESV